MLLLGLRPSLSLSKDEWHAVDAAMDELGILAVQQRRPDAISGGQQQRVALARALIRAEWQDRQLLLFDEPFSALDPTLGPIVLIASNILWLVKTWRRWWSAIIRMTPAP